MSNKHTYEYIKNYIESFQNYELLSKGYTDTHTKIELKCPKGHIFWMRFSNFQQGQRCPNCYVENKGELKKLTYGYVRSFVEESEYEMLSKKYTKSNEKIELKCPKGHIFWMRFSNFQQGQRCPNCSGKKGLTYKYVKGYIGSFKDYKLLSGLYINTRTKLKIQCPHGHIFWMSFANFKKGKRCPECAGNKKLTNQEIIESLQKYENIRENKNSEIEVTCRYCGKWFIPIRQNLRGRILYVNGGISTEYSFYCSQGCKDNCPIYNQSLYPRGYAPSTSREVQPQLRQLVFERDNYTCQKCGWHKDDLDVGLHCHHKYPLNENPIESADVDACITLCEDCHKWIHQNVAGCGYGEMRCSE